MQCIAHDAITIVLQQYKGQLESFEKDERGRLLLADLIGRRIIRSRPDEGAERQAIERWRKLVPEYVEVGMRKGPLHSQARITEISRAFREAIYDRLRASVFERMGQAQRLIASYYATILEGFPIGPKPTITAMHNMNFLHLPTQDGAMAISPIRLDLVKKLQRLVPEMGFTTISVPTENSSGILTELAANLNGRARDFQNEYRDVIETRNRARW